MFTQEKIEDMASRLFNTILNKYDENASLYYTIHGQERPLIIADWNRIGDKWPKLMRALDSCGSKFEIEFGFNDEFVECDNCGTAVVTTPSSWDWQPDFVTVPEVGWYCRDCVEEDNDIWEDVIGEFKNNRDKALPDWCFKLLEEKGWKCLENDEMACSIFESGMHPGQNDSPSDTANWIEQNLPHHNYVFIIIATGQFDVNWTVFLKRVE